MTILPRTAFLVALLGCMNRPAPSPPVWEVSIRGYGPIEAGMTIAAASKLSGRTIQPAAPGAEECDIVGFTGDSSGRILFLVTHDSIQRVDVLDSSVITNHGARIGDSESRVDSLYPGRVVVQPHKYEDGHYLIVSPGKPEDSSYALVFETVAGRVTQYRAGRRPAVEWVEGCS